MMWNPRLPEATPPNKANLRTWQAVAIRKPQRQTKPIWRGSGPAAGAGAGKHEIRRSKPEVQNASRRHYQRAKQSQSATGVARRPAAGGAEQSQFGLRPIGSNCLFEKDLEIAWARVAAVKTQPIGGCTRTQMGNHLENARAEGYNDTKFMLVLCLSSLAGCHAEPVRPRSGQTP